MDTVNIFDTDVRANKSPRNAFDIGYSTITSSPLGMLLPVYVEDVKRGDHIRLDCAIETRTRPVNTSAFMVFDQKIDFYFVPYRIIWSGYDEFRLSQPYPHTSASLYPANEQSLVPHSSWTSLFNYLNSFKSRGTSLSTVPAEADLQPFYVYAFRLLDLLGYGAPANDRFSLETYLASSEDAVDLMTNARAYMESLDAGGHIFNYFRLAAFNAIYQHFYRREEFEPLSPWTFNVDNLFSQLHNPASPNVDPTPQTYSTPYNLVAGGDPYLPINYPKYLCFNHLFTPHYRNWRDDLFTSIRPNNGYDDTLNIGTPSNGQIGSAGSSFDWPYSTDPNNGVGSVSNLPPSFDSFNGSSASLQSQPQSMVAPTTSLRVYSDSAYPNSEFALLYAQQLRQLMAQDSFVRSVILTRKDLPSQLRAVFGDGKDYDNHRPVYLGTFDNTVNIDEIVAQSAGNDGDASDLSSSILGQLAGKGYGTSNGHVFDSDFDEDGVVIGVHSICPRNNYDSYRVSKFNVKSSRYDYFYPQYDGLGLQPVHAFERNTTGTINESNPDTFNSNVLYGFAPRYYEYKQRQNEVHGSFMTGQPDYEWTITNNSIGILFGDNPFSYKVTPRLSNRLFTVGYDGSIASDPFFMYIRYNATRLSDLERTGVKLTL